MLTTRKTLLDLFDKRVYLLVSSNVFLDAYVTVLFVQNDVASGFAIEESFHTTILAGLPEVKFSGDGSEALFAWLQAEIVERAFTEPAKGRN